jgi:dUTP pyrophosphatase
MAQVSADEFSIVTSSSIYVKKIKEEAVLPTRGSVHSAGIDLYSCLDKPIIVFPRERVLIQTGIIIAIPNGLYGAIYPRSGLALSHGITVLNTPGVIDSDYRGEIKCIVVNLSDTAFEITNKMKIAQLIIQEYKSVQWQETNNLSETDRGSKGFGSTGV